MSEQEKIEQVDPNVGEEERSPVVHEVSPENRGCKWGEWYQHGDKICLSGKVYKCDDGTWRATGYGC